MNIIDVRLQGNPEGLMLSTLWGGRAFCCVPDTLKATSTGAK
ncbi:MAG: hypothetical protein QGG23_02000 [Candidatus Bathyarchaeota archaeon]|nr:hypothetical protein [Candidatus Bathyarchaeota archaeon]